MYIIGEDVFRRYPVMRTWGMTPELVTTDLIPYAEAELNGLLAGTFAVPFTDGSSSFTIKDLAIELSYCKALWTKDPKQWQARHQSILDRIDRIKLGQESISDVGSGMTSTAQEPWSTTMNYAPVHGMADAEDSRIDPLQLQDERDKRGTFGDDGQ